MSTIETTLGYIDRRIENYSLPLFTRIIDTYIQGSIGNTNAPFLLRTALRTANFFDIYFETRDDIFLQEARKYRELFYSSIADPQDKKELEDLERQVLHFFEFEKACWDKVQRDEPLSDEEVNQFLRMKSSDALFYGRVIKIFTPGMDFTEPIYTNMQLLDLMVDIQEYERDIAENNPNILFMKLHQKLREKVKVPKRKQDAIALARALGVDEELLSLTQTIMQAMEGKDFTGYEFLIDSIDEKVKAIKNELTR